MNRTIYFAYGSNMDPAQMEDRCPGARPVGVARLADHRLRFTYDSPHWEGGVATVEPHEGDEVWGVLWALDDEHVRTLDRYEGVPAVYRREQVTVTAGGGDVEAMLYVTNEITGTLPSQRYMAGIIGGARSFGLPGPYIELLQGLPTA